MIGKCYDYLNVICGLENKSLIDTNSPPSTQCLRPISTIGIRASCL